MNEYTRLFLHFLHALGRDAAGFDLPVWHPSDQRDARAMRARDPDDALARCSALVSIGPGGTRIGESLTRFNRDWSRRVLGPGRDHPPCSPTGSSATASTGSKSKWSGCAKSSRRLIWVNPLLAVRRLRRQGGRRFARCCPTSTFRPIHNLASMAGPVPGAVRARDGASDDPKVRLLAVVVESERDSLARAARAGPFSREACGTRRGEDARMSDQAIETVAGKSATIQFNGDLCIHARRCVLSEPAVFKANVEGPLD